MRSPVFWGGFLGVFGSEQTLAKIMVLSRNRNFLIRNDHHTSKTLASCCSSCFLDTVCWKNPTRSDRLPFEARFEHRIVVFTPLVSFPVKALNKSAKLFSVKVFLVPTYQFNSLYDVSFVTKITYLYQFIAMFSMQIYFEFLEFIN